MTNNELLAKLTKYENENLVAMITCTNDMNYEYLTDIDNIKAIFNGAIELDYNEFNYSEIEKGNDIIHFMILNETTINFIYDISLQDIDNVTNAIMQGILYSDSCNYIANL